MKVETIIIDLRPKCDNCGKVITGKVWAVAQYSPEEKTLLYCSKCKKESEKLPILVV